MTRHASSAILTDELERARVRHELIPHRRTSTALGEARALVVSPSQVAKTLVSGSGSRGGRVDRRGGDGLTSPRTRRSMFGDSTR
jgi:hypothetical protein